MVMTFMLKDLPLIADQLVLNATSKTILFYGEMGVGKTTLIKEIAKRIGVNEMINSPSYSIVNEYELENGKLFHFDCFRFHFVTSSTVYPHSFIQSIMVTAHPS